MKTILLMVLLGFAPGAPNRLTKLERFVLEDLAGKVALKHIDMKAENFTQQVMSELQTEAHSLLGVDLNKEEQEYVLSIIPTPPKKPEFTGPPKPDKNGIIKEWLDVTLDGKTQKIWAWRDPDNSKKILYIPGDKPDESERIPD